MKQLKRIDAARTSNLKKFENVQFAATCFQLRNDGLRATDGGG